MKEKIKFSEEFYKKTFTADNMKIAYMAAVKWYATNVLSKDELHNVHVEFEKDKQSPTITIHLFAALDDETEVFEHHCKCCKDMHHSFFINENNNCNICAAAGYQNRIKQTITGKVNHYKELIAKRLGGKI